MKKTELIDIIIPISLELDWPTEESIVSEVLEQHKLYGFQKFAFAAPSGGWRSVGYPPSSYFEERANLFLKVKKRLEPFGIICGWWITATIKSGASEKFTRIVRKDGSYAPFSSCPLDPVFRKQFSENVALFAQIAKPAFIITEDDYSVIASAPGYGCFCKHHLEAFSLRQGKAYTGEMLVTELEKDTEESLQLLRAWRELIKDSLVGLAESIREAVDRESPEIPIGYMQSGSADQEGDCTVEVAKALAGKNHTPFVRFFGAFYCGVPAEQIPCKMFHPIYCRQHTPEDMIFYHESDTFPHTRFFTSGSDMRAIMSIAYSTGFDGSTFQTQQLVDCANEETAYAKMFATERKRYERVYQIVKQCKTEGIELCYDPFWNTTAKGTKWPEWTQAISLFGIPYTTREASVAFWDKTQAACCDDATIRKYLSKGLFLDGEAARILCERGYGAYLGIRVGEDVAAGMLGFDLGAREVICKQYQEEGKGKHMPIAHMFASGKNGKLLKIKVMDPACEVVTEAYTFQYKYIAPAMTKFTNELGGQVVVMGMTLTGNYSQSLLNYRRQRLIQRLITEYCDEYAYVKEVPRVYTIMNTAENEAGSAFKGMLTLINLSSDPAENCHIHMPEKWKDLKQVQSLNLQGEWENVNWHQTEDGIILEEALAYLMPVYLLLQ